MNMKTMNLVFGALVLAAAFLAPPALLGSVVAGSAGLMLLASAGLTPAQVAAAPLVPMVHVVRVADPVRVVELDGGGVVVFRQVEGKLVTRFYRA